MVVRRTSLAGLATMTLALGCVPTLASPMRDLQAENPGTKVFELDGKLSRLYGKPMSTGRDVYESADRFLMNHADVFGLRAENLRLRVDADGMDVLPMMLNRATGEYKFVALKFDQVHEGLTVHGGSLTLLFRNQSGYPMVEAISGLKTIAADGLAIEMNNLIAPLQIGTSRDYPTDGSEPVRTVIFLDPNNGEGDTPTVAYTYVVTTGQPSDGVATDFFSDEKRSGTYDRRRVFVDAKTGVLLHSESLIHALDVEGSVDAWATPGLLPDASYNLPTLQSMPRVYADILSGNRGETDQFGDFLIAHGGSGQVTVRSRMYGPSLSNGVIDQGGGELQLDVDVTPPGPANFEHNQGKTEFDTAEVNAMLHTSIIHNFLGSIIPNYPGLNRSFVANVNNNSSCNAFYDGSSINFYRAGGGCANMAFSTIVYHEYGHKIVDDGVSNPGGDYHEGFGDTVAVIITDDPISGRDVFGQGQNGRTADNNIQYPCNGEIHYCGGVLSGCVWHTRDELVVTEPVDYLQIIQDLTINSTLLHTGNINPGITIDFLTLDDDDNNISNGTPHYTEINAGFSRHNMDAPPISFLEFEYPSGRPTSVSPDGGTTMRVEVQGVVSDPEPGTGRLHVNDGSGWVDLAMTEVSANVYDAVFPAVACPSTVNYYVSVDTTGGKNITDPTGAPSVSYSAFGASNVDEILVEDFENAVGNGWTTEHVAVTDGHFGFGVPAGAGDRGDPTADFDGSGACALTDNVAGNSDVDGGPTRIISPAFDLSGGSATVQYAYWFTNDDNDGDRLSVDLSNDGGSNWTAVRSYGNGAGWNVDSFEVDDFVTPTADMRIRFSATDNPNDSVTEGAVDAVSIVRATCGEPGGLFLTAEPIISGQQTRFIATQGVVGSTVYFAYSLAGLGDTIVPPLNVTLGIKNPKLAGTAKVNVAGFATLVRRVPDGTSGTEVWVQAAAFNKVSNIANQVIQ